MLQVGIFTGYFPGTLEETARRIRALGFNTVQLDLAFKDVDLSTENITRANCTRIRDTFRRHNLPVSCISSYTNVVEPGPEKRKANHARLRRIIEHAHDLGSPYVPVETGTFNRESEWLPHPQNQTEAGYAECLDVIGGFVNFCRKHGVVFVIEPYVNNVISSIERTQRLFADINDPQHLGLAMDPCNYFETHNIGRIDETLNAIFDALAPTIRFAHAKDVKLIEQDKGVQLSGGLHATEGHAFRGSGRIEQPAVGFGQLNYELYLRRLSRSHPNLPIIIEHLEEADVPRAKKFLEDKLTATGT